MSTTLTSEQISSLAALEVYNEQGGKVKVGSLFEGEAKTTVIFLRHFYCAFDKQTMQLPDLMPNGIPSNQDLHYLASLEVLDESGEKVKFGSLFAEKKTLVVFVRSWLCGKCTLYIRQLSEVITPSKFEAAGLNVVVVGCGGHELVKGFKENTSCTFPIYADPTRATFLKLGCSWTLDMTPKGQSKKAYLTKSPLSEAFGSIKFGLSNLSLVGKAGDLRQNGGEFIFGPGETCSFAHRMQNSEDHTDLPELFATVGIPP